jgi:hypothetical protein
MIKTELDLEGLEMPKYIERELKNFCKFVIQSYGAELESLIIYGSLARAEYFPSTSDINLLIVMSSIRTDHLTRILDEVHEAKRSINLSPFIISEKEIQTSTDVFPMKFHDMQDAYSVIYGRDIVGPLQIDDTNTRLCCEQEMKLMLLNLRQLYLRRGHNLRGVQELLQHYIATFAILTKTMLHLMDIEAPRKAEEVLHRVQEHFGLEASTVKKMIDLRHGRDVGDLATLFDEFCGMVEFTSDIVDKLEV